MVKQVGFEKQILQDALISCGSVKCVENHRVNRARVDKAVKVLTLRSVRNRNRAAAIVRQLCHDIKPQSCGIGPATFQL